MKTIHCAFLLTLATLWASVAVAFSAEPQPGVAIAIVYDTSGSMTGSVPNSRNQMEPKFKIASEAMKNIVEKVDDYARTHPVEATLITFQGTPVPFGKWNRAALDTWLSKFNSPAGGTPLGEAIASASDALKPSKLPRKHIVVLTDGESNGTITPEAAIRDMKKREGAGSPQVYVVAFDVNSKAFDSVKKAGSTVLPASGKTLESGLRNLFSEKILLEEEE
jgi:hypothetical protein